MALGSAGLAGTGGSHDKYVPEIWSKRIQSAFEKRTIARKYCLDLSDLLSAQGGDVLHVPKLANRTATTRALTSFAQITPAGATEDEFTMNVQTWIHDPEFVSDALTEQTKLFMKSQIDGKMQSSLAVKFDTDLWANYSSLTSTPEGTDDGETPASFDDVEDAITQVVQTDADRSDCVIILTPKTLSGFIKDKILASGDYTMNRAMETGVVPVLAGCPVFMSNNLPTAAGGSKVNLVLHKEAFAFAVATPARVRSQMTLDHLGETIVGDMIYGSKVYRPTAGVAVYGL